MPFPWLRKTVILKKKPVRRMAYVNPLGYYELYINGKKVGDQVLSPAVSDYSKRNLYVTHDVADYLAGKNCVALWLGRGWYVPAIRGRCTTARWSGLSSKLAAGGTDRPSSGHRRDLEVRDSPLSPLGRGTAFGDYGGERYDARLELPGWNTTRDLDDSDWTAGDRLRSAPVSRTAAQMVQPNRIMRDDPARHGLGAVAEACTWSTWDGTSPAGSRSADSGRRASHPA